MFYIIEAWMARPAGLTLVPGNEVTDDDGHQIICSSGCTGIDVCQITYECLFAIVQLNRGSSLTTLGTTFADCTRFAQAVYND